MDEQNILKIIRSAISEQDEREEKRRAKLTKEEIADMKEMHKVADHAKEARKNWESMRQKFWAGIELRLQEFGDMKLDEKTNEIIILEDDDEDE